MMLITFCRKRCNVEWGSCDYPRSWGGQVDLITYLNNTEQYIRSYENKYHHPPPLCPKLQTMKLVARLEKI